MSCTLKWLKELFKPDICVGDSVLFAEFLDKTLNYAFMDKGIVVQKKYEPHALYMVIKTDSNEFILINGKFVVKYEDKQP
jgi:hypothetical protein